jgi:protoporphyrinogen/coproporphyrinogen III oxidase
MRVAILGAGIAGLSVAHFVHREAARRTLPLELTVYEAGPRAGGRIRTQEDAGYRVEWAANGIQGTDGAASRLAEQLGLASETVVARPEAARRYILKGGKLHLLPLSPPALVRFGALSARGKLRLVAEPFFARRATADETVHDFAARHMGEEAASTLIGTVVRGVFAGDARRLSLDASFPIMRDMERKHRSLVVAMIRGKRSPGGRTLWSLRGGIESLVRALAAEAGPGLKLGAPALSLARAGDGPRAGWTLRLASGETASADAVVVAAPPRAAAALLRGLEPEIARPLAALPCAGLAVVGLGFRPESFRTPPDGYGFLVAPGDEPGVLGALCETNLWPERAPEGRILIRAMVGGVGAEAVVTRSDAELVGLAMKALDRAWGLAGGPERSWVIRQTDAIPQYPVGHRHTLGTIAGRLDLWPGLHLAGSAYRGVSVAALVEDAERVAARVVERAA